MKSLVEFISESNIASIYDCIINEALLQTKDFDKHNYKYIKGLLSKLLNGDNVRLGPTGNDGVINIKQLSDDEKSKAKSMLDDLVNGEYDNISIERFNEIFSSVDLKLTRFFKGDYSGYSDGLESGNKGNAFEAYFIKNYAEKFEDDIKKIFPYETRKGISADGQANTKRPLTFSNNSITCGKIEGDDFNIGKTVTDVTVSTDKGDIYLSLKSGKSVTFVNAGIKTLFNKSFFDGEKAQGNAKTLLDMLCIDEDKFRSVFLNYKGQEGRKERVEKDEVDITNELKKNDIFKRFMKSVMGYGFIMVHQIKGDNVEYIDLLTSEALNKYIKDINKAVVLYPKDGKAKRVDVVIEYDEIKFKLNIRSKDGGVNPTHLMADYEFVH